MTSIKFSRVKDLGRSATWLRVLGSVIIGLCSIFGISLSMSMIRLIVVIPGAYYAWTSYYESKKIFEEIAFNEQTFKFYFQNALKDLLSFNRSEVSVEVFEDKIVYQDMKSNELIGTLYKKQLQEEENWNVLSDQI